MVVDFGKDADVFTIEKVKQLQSTPFFPSFQIPENLFSKFILLYKNMFVCLKCQNFAFQGKKCYNC